MPITKRLGSCLLTLSIILCMFYQPAAGHHYPQQDIYQRAWQLTRDNYYDANFSGQNWAAWEHKYDGQIRSTADAYKAIKTMLDSLNDPYTRFLDPRAFQDENDAIDARIVGIGINLQPSKDNSYLVVTRTIDDSPADIAGMQAGDQIVSIDGTAAMGLSPEQAAEKIRGKAGTAVRISVQRHNEVKAFHITRAEIAIHAVTSKVMPNNIGYIQLTTFISNDASREFRLALQKLANTNGLIIDLRDNPGGLLSNALEIADMLLESGSIVSTIGRHGKHTDVASGDPVTHQPIVVLVDEDSASASEILAGALKDNRRAVVIGTRTYGKGLVQEINRLPGGAAVHITVSKYYTPSGSDINKVGVAPDIQVNKKEEQMKAAIDCLKEKIAALQGPIHTSSLPVMR